MAKRRQPAAPAPPAPLPSPCAPVRGALFEFSDRITRRAWTQPFTALAHRHDILAGVEAESHTARITHRRLRIYTQDPSTPKGRIPTADVLVPYEPLAPGPVGAVVAVVDVNETSGETYAPVDLDELGIAMNGGLKPSTATPGFAQQMTYALAMLTYERFGRALGRPPQFSFPPHDDDGSGVAPQIKLHIHPHAFEEDNAFYDPDLGALRFGYTRAGEQAQGLDQPGGLVFTALSHDVVVHEMTHALLDGMRSHFMLPTNPDVDGFHEGFADLIAIFQRFAYRDIVSQALQEARGALTSRLLVDLARQFGAATGDGRTPLRSALATLGDLDEPVAPEHLYSPDLEAHDMGAVLLRAVFDAFRTVFDAKTARLRGLATVDGPLPPGLIDLLTSEASRLAEQFAGICIRAVDYCPPIDLRLGEYLRAMVTADFDLVPDDPWGYREALVRAFRRHGVRVDGVADLSEESLLWRGPERRLIFHPPTLAPGTTPQQAQCAYAGALGPFVTHPDHLYTFGLAHPDTRKKIERPVIESVRVLRRVGPDDTVNDDIVAEIVQRRKVGHRWMYGGSTVVAALDGTIRYVVVKHIQSATREARIREHLSQHPGVAAAFEDAAPRGARRLRGIHRRRREGR